MSLDAERFDPPVKDAASAVLKWVLLAVAIVTFAPIYRLTMTVFFPAT